MNNANLIPPLIVMRKEGHLACSTPGNVLSWFNSKVLRRSDAFVIHDPNRWYCDNFSLAFSRSDYVVKMLNLSDTMQSMRYNPFVYVQDGCGVSKLANALISGTTGIGKSGDIDFVFCETMLLNALISYIHLEAPFYEQNIQVLTRVLEHMIMDDYQEGYASAVDILFAEKEKIDPLHPSVLLFDDFMDAAYDGEYVISVAESCIERLAPFNTPDMVWLMSGDDLRLDNLTDRKTALFIVDGQADENRKLLVPLLFSQLFDAHYGKCG